MARHIVYTEYASGASRALLRYIPASSPGYLIQVLYDILALLIGQPAIHHCQYRPLHNCSSISFQGKSQKIFFRSFSATCRYRDLLTSRYGYSMPIVLSHWIAIMPLLRRYRRHIATPIALNLLYFRSAREDTR
jgi:hypothetical protein